jgi:hypothetical protein
VDKELKLLLNRYVNREVPLEDVKSWISHNIWDAQPDVDDSIDTVAIRLVHLDDGIIDQPMFRKFMMDLLGLFQYIESNEQHLGFRPAPVFAALATNTFIVMGGPPAPLPFEYAVTAKTDAVTALASVAG